MSGSSATRPPACPDYRVTCAEVEVGAGWNNINQTTRQPYVGLLSLCHPDIGPRACKVNLGCAANQDDDVIALIWNAED